MRHVKKEECKLNKTWSFALASACLAAAPVSLSLGSRRCRRREAVRRGTGTGSAAAGGTAGAATSSTEPGASAIRRSRGWKSAQQWNGLDRLYDG